jgi:hypothetical protein
MISGSGRQSMKVKCHANVRRKMAKAKWWQSLLILEIRSKCLNRVRSYECLIKAGVLELPGDISFSCPLYLLLDFPIRSSWWEHFPVATVSPTFLCYPSSISLPYLIGTVKGNALWLLLLKLWEDTDIWDTKHCHALIFFSSHNNPTEQGG